MQFVSDHIQEHAEEYWTQIGDTGEDGKVVSVRLRPHSGTQVEEYWTQVGHERRAVLLCVCIQEHRSKSIGRR